MSRESLAAWWRRQFSAASVRRRFHWGAGIACVVFAAALAMALFLPGRWRIAGIYVRVDSIRNPLLELLASAAVSIATREDLMVREKALLRRLALVWSAWDARARFFALVLTAQVLAGAVYVARYPDYNRGIHRLARSRFSGSLERLPPGADRPMQFERFFEECRRLLPPTARVLYHGRTEGELLSYVIYPRPVFMLPQERYAAWIASQLFETEVPEDPLFPSALPRPRGDVDRDGFLREHRITHEVTFVEGNRAACRIEAVR